MRLDTQAYAFPKPARPWISAKFESSARSLLAEPLQWRGGSALLFPVSFADNTNGGVRFTCRRVIAVLLRRRRPARGRLCFLAFWRVTSYAVSTRFFRAIQGPVRTLEQLHARSGGAFRVRCQTG